MTPKKHRRSQAIISAPAPLTLGEGENAITILVRPPTPADAITMQKWARERAPLAAPQGLSSDEMAHLSPEDRLALLREYARAKVERRGLSQDEFYELMITPDGLAMMIWLAAKRQHPEISFNDIRKRITEDNLLETLAAFDAATTLDREDVIGEQDPKPHGPG